MSIDGLTLVMSIVLAIVGSVFIGMAFGLPAGLGAFFLVAAVKA